MNRELVNAFLNKPEPQPLETPPPGSYACYCPLLFVIAWLAYRNDNSRKALHHHGRNWRSSVHPLIRVWSIPEKGDLG